jgi:hypothetical protein
LPGLASFGRTRKSPPRRPAGKFRSVFAFGEHDIEAPRHGVAVASNTARSAMECDEIIFDAVIKESATGYLMQEPGLLATNGNMYRIAVFP